MSRVASIWRHPIKAVGRESLEQVDVTPGQAMPYDRHWAVAHEASKHEGGEWASCMNFIRAASSPSLMAVTCEMDGERITLRHPDQPEVTLHPDEDSAALVEWLKPLVARTAPARVVRAQRRGFTDSRTAGITICNSASLKALEQRLGRPLSPHRFRGNIWLDDLAPWEEFEWVDKELQIGSARVRVYGRTERCRATEANPETGQRDTDTLGLLRELGHQDFSVKAEIIAPGTIALDDEVRLL